MDQIGRYRILSELGRGAMGVVYRAEDPKIGRQVAIKTLKLAEQADASEIDGLRERLMREAQSAGRLSHPGIVTIYDVDEAEGVAYIAMEFVEGKTFDGFLREGLLRDVSFGAEVIAQTAAALDYAHSKDIVHRDIKPANLMLTANNVLKIMDFGIARVSSSQLTQTGTVMGTPSYMSPEQVRGESLDGRSDQFSLAVIAYEMLTGKKPFSGDSLTTVIFKIVSSEPEKASRLCSWLKPEVDRVIGKALSKKPAERYESCKKFAENFRAALEGVVIPEGAKITPEAGLDSSITWDVGKQEAAAANDETAYGVKADSTTVKADSTTASRVVEEPAKLPPIERAAESVAVEEEPEESRKGLWLALLAAVVLAAFAGAVEATTGSLLADPVAATQQAWATWFGSPQIETATEPVEEEPLIGLEAVDSEESADDTQQQEELASTEEVAAATAAQSVEAVVTPPPAPAPVRPTPARTSSVYFRTNPPGAMVVVDERAEWTCRTPCTIENLPAGSRNVTARLAGFQTTRRSFVAGSESQMILEIGLEDARIQLLVTSEPNGADIYIDDVLIPQKTDAKIPLAEGTYRIRVQKAGIGAAQQVVQVNRESLPFAQFTLQRQAP